MEGTRIHAVFLTLMPNAPKSAGQMRAAVLDARDWLVRLLGDASEASCLPDEVIPALRGELMRLDTLLLAQLVREGNEREKPVEDRLLNTDEASQKLGVTVDWLYRHTHTLPFVVRVGPRQLRFSQAGIERWIRRKSFK